MANLIDDSESKRSLKPNSLFGSISKKMLKPNSLFNTVGKRSLKPNSLFNTMGKRTLKPNSLFGAFGKKSLKPNSLFNTMGKRNLKPNSLFGALTKKSLKPNSLFGTYGKRDLKPNSLFTAYGKRTMKPNGLFTVGKRALKPNGLFSMSKRSIVPYFLIYDEDEAADYDIEEGDENEEEEEEEGSEEEMLTLKRSNDPSFWAARGKREASSSMGDFFAARFISYQLFTPCVPLCLSVPFAIFFLIKVEFSSNFFSSGVAGQVLRWLHPLTLTSLQPEDKCLSPKRNQNISKFFLREYLFNRGLRYSWRRFSFCGELQYQTHGCVVELC